MSTPADLPADPPAPSFPATIAKPTLVEHRETGTRFILLGTGYGLALDTQPGLLFPVEKKPCDMMVCVCDVHGELGWLPSMSVRVVQVGGVDPSAVEGLAEFDEMHFPEPTKPSAEDVELRCVECDRPLVGKVCASCETRPLL
ncbi:MAG: hypothetical protein AAFY88_07380 [Acidobacteriota bacterium]